jgi:D-alanine--poly(phosphoribitol) ligase subunit 1
MTNTCIKYLEYSSEKYSDKIAIIDDNRQVNFKQLKLNSLQIASKINKAYSNQPIAVYLPKCIDAIECFMGILYSGNFYAPLDVKSPVERIKLVIKNLEPVIILTNSNYYNILIEHFSDMNIEVIDIENNIKGIDYFHSDTIKKVIDTDPVYCIYTSGSTGTPKGVLISHRGVNDYIEWATMCFGINSNDVIGSQAPFHFDNSTLDVYLMLKTGATLVLITEYLFGFPVKLSDFILEKKINTIFWVPSVMTMFMSHDALRDKELPLTKILFAGEVMPVKVLNYWRKHIPNAIYSNLYGPTEITVDCTYYTVTREFEDNESLPIGKACINTDILILNEKNQICSNDEIGELCVRGSSLALGYWNNPIKTKEAFVQNPLNEKYDELIYKTGDLVKTNSLNEILYIGRKDSQIKHFGYRIELGDIESTVNSVNQISNSCVLYDEDNKEIVLIYELISNATISETDIRKQLFKILPKYMIPTKLFHVDILPSNANGKIDRILLKNKYMSVNAMS